MLAFEVKVEGSSELTERFRRAPERIRKAWAVALQKEMARGTTYLVQRHRSGPTSATATKRITSNLAGSYSENTLPTPDGVEGEMGLMRYSAQGKALSYGWIHELGFSGTVPAAQCVSKLGKPYVRRAHNVYIPARPPGGAVEAARKYIQPQLITKIAEASTAVLNGGAA